MSVPKIPLNKKILALAQADIKYLHSSNTFTDFSIHRLQVCSQNCPTAPEMSHFTYGRIRAPQIYSVSTKKRPPLSIIVYYSKYLADIIEIFTTEFSIYLYIVCKNLWKFNVKIVFYYMFSITRSKHKFP